MIEQKKKVGRPVTGGRKREAAVQVRLTENEREVLFRRAQEAGITLSAYVREQVVASVLQSNDCKLDGNYVTFKVEGIQYTWPQDVARQIFKKLAREFI